MSNVISVAEVDRTNKLLHDIFTASATQEATERSHTSSVSRDELSSRRKGRHQETATFSVSN